MKRTVRVCGSLSIAAVGLAACTARSDTTFDDLRRADQGRQAGYPAPPAPVDRQTWPSLISNAGPPINGSQGGTTPIEPSHDAGSHEASTGHEGGAPEGGTEDSAVPDDGGEPEGGVVGGGVDELLTSYTTFSPASSGDLATAGGLNSATVSSTGTPVIVYPGTPATLSVTYYSPQAAIDAFAVTFGNSQTTARIPYKTGPSGTANITVNVDSGICDSLSPGCYAFGAEVSALTGVFPNEAISKTPAQVTGALVCGNCQSQGCATLDPKCAGGPSTVSACGSTNTGSGNATTVIQVAMGATSGISQLQASTVGYATQFQVRQGSSVLVDTGCVTSGSKPAQPFSFSIPASQPSQLSVTVIPRCNGLPSDLAQWSFSLSCPGSVL